MTQILINGIVVIDRFDYHTRFDTKRALSPHRQRHTLGGPDLWVDTLPAFNYIWVAFSLILVALWVLAVRALKVDTKSSSVVDELRTDQGLWGITVFYPVHHGHQYVFARIIAIDLARSLADSVCTISSTAMSGAANGEVAVKGVELIRG